MMNIKPILVTGLFSTAAILTPTQFVLADSYTVPMQILENGTNKTSYAAAYFAGSATVTPSENGYTVTSTITTDTSLGNYPVQMLSVDGAGVSVAKSQSGNNQTITYAFQTANLTARHNANIRVDVDSINYHHNYTVGLVIDGASIPAPQKATVTEASVAHNSATAPSEANAATKTTTTATSVTSTTSTATSSQSESSVTASSDSSSLTSSSENKKATPAKKFVTPKPVASETPLPIAAIIGGGLVIGVAGAIALNLLKKK